jgi:fumarate hydratase subunit alpha
MREIDVRLITEQVRDLCIQANIDLGEDVLQAFDRAIEKEESPVAVDILKELKENARIAKEEKVPICQDTGFAVVFIEVGQDVHLVGKPSEAIHEGVRRGTERATSEVDLSSVHSDEFRRQYACRDSYRVGPGDRIKITLALKGAGSENMSRVVMLTPSDGVEGIKRFVIQRVKESGSNPCPPTIVGVGIGGTMEQAALLAKKSLLRPLGSKNPSSELDQLESEMLAQINQLGIGPQGLGGRTTSLAVLS